MTTGNMILIDDKKIYMSIPFCGDMEPEANGRVSAAASGLKRRA